MQNLPYGVALEAIKQGKRAARAGWNGKGMFVFQRPADALPITFIPKVKSLPDSVKTAIADAHYGETHYAGGAEITIEFGAYLCLYTASGTIQNGWTASQPDQLAEDWTILD